MRVLNPVTVSLLTLLLASVTFVYSAPSNFCVTTAGTVLSGRFVDPDALLFNLSEPIVPQCRQLCCSTAGCRAFSLATVANEDGLFACYLHQTPLLTVQASTNYTAMIVDTAADPQHQLLRSLTLTNVRLIDAVEVPGVDWWTASNCSNVCTVLPGCIAVESAPIASSLTQYSCRPIAYFTSLAADPYSDTIVTLVSHAVPQPTPLDYDYSQSSHGSPMRGWNTYDSYGSVPPEPVLLANAKFMAANMLQAGYRLMSLDWGWWFDMKGNVMLDETGRYQVAEDRFPSSAGGKGLKPFADQLHSMGLLLGVYEDAGVSIYYNNTGEHHIPVGEQCVWPGNSYFLDWTDPAAQEWLDTKVQQWAEWGVDYVKIDCVGSIVGWQNVFMYSTSIARSSRPDMKLSISPGYNGDTQSERIIAPYVDEYRVAVDQHDLWDTPISFYPAIPQAVDYAIKLEGLYAGLPMVPSVANRSEEYQRLSYPDMDILPFGLILSMVHGGNLTWSAFNHTQQQTAFSIWCFYRSPLLYGGRLTPDALDMESIAIVTNEQLLHIHQNAYRSTSSFVNHTWLTVSSGRAELGEEYILLANINSTLAWDVYVVPSMGGSCDWVEAWSGRVERGVSSVQVSLSYAQSAVWTIGNCTSAAVERASASAVESVEAEQAAVSIERGTSSVSSVREE